MAPPHFSTGVLTKETQIPTPRALWASSSFTLPPQRSRFLPPDALFLAHSCIRNTFPEARLHARSQTAFSKTQTSAFPEVIRTKELLGEHAQLQYTLVPNMSLGVLDFLISYQNLSCYSELP